MFRRQDILARMEKLYPFDKKIAKDKEIQVVPNTLVNVKGMTGG